ncbi:3-ketoacyl-ACP reductase [Bradyrhizobium jicamae]|uniref:3-ketoacyl-ACP reductase n=1 Tax=Bradyrhizobium jicamae TaxID=280332 RepID=A0A0R3LV80_9BRAD|nr:glucose 1-dehydrogenase [Bradyrhizobium jicamae]KRR08957.1 3-ketoacyl-ACP reductase [Bradyrhizobium jicamae]
MRLKDKIAIVTGGGSGFGEGIVRKFVEEGARVVIADRDEAATERVAGALPGRTIAAVADISNESGFAAVVQTAHREFGGLDILVNNAGVGHTPQPLETVTDEMFDRIANVNIKSIYYGAKAVVPHFKQRKYGIVLNVASTGGVSPRPNLTWYNASKGWVITATRAMAVELAPFGIRVNAINPVAGETPLLKTFMGQDTPEIRAKFLSTIPIGRFSTPEDMGNAAAFLCSDEASMITGVAMEVDGGRCI